MSWISVVVLEDVSDRKYDITGVFGPYDTERAALDDPRPNVWAEANKEEGRTCGWDVRAYELIDPQSLEGPFLLPEGATREELEARLDAWRANDAREAAIVDEGP